MRRWFWASMTAAALLLTVLWVAWTVDSFFATINATAPPFGDNYFATTVSQSRWILVFGNNLTPQVGINRYPFVDRSFVEALYPPKLVGVGLGQTPPSSKAFFLYYLRVPTPYLALLSAGTAGLAGWRWRRARADRRESAGRCPGCGYDLRASPRLCPECGRDVSSPEPVSRPNPEIPVSKKILDVGQCGMDGPALKKLLQSRLDADVTDAATGDAADRELSNGDFDLILVNRVFDQDDASGLDWIERYKQTGGTAPVMLVSDKTDAQASAEQLGAAPGFGKSKMKDQATLDLIRGTMGDE